MAKRRLRTGPTAALPAKPSQSDLLRLVRLADPEAREDGADIVAVDVRVHAPVEADPELVGGELEQVWACRVVAEGPLPFDYFDRYLAEGIAFRLGGLAVCRGEVTDPADSDRGGPAVILPERPTADELRAVLSGLDDAPKADISDETNSATDDTAPEDTTTADATPTEAGTSATVDAETDADAKAETDTDAETDAEAEASADAETEAATEATEATEVAEATEVTAAPGDDIKPDDANPDDFLYTVGDIRVLVVPEKGRPPAVQELLPFATELTAIELRGDDPEKVGALALRLADALNGLIVDRWRFRIDAAEDLLPPG
ncbi:hypothetical protein ACQP2T_55565 [Nonomuraea sp. CA-143628]|uniref:hypothetical protein n=1 Tax=Nonomuraea sp. CA-143628 TaxID=3239997 RepID=UPI003D8E33CC